MTAQETYLNSKPAIPALRESLIQGIVSEDGVFEFFASALSPRDKLALISYFEIKLAEWKNSAINDLELSS